MNGFEHSFLNKLHSLARESQGCEVIAGKRFHVRSWSIPTFDTNIEYFLQRSLSWYIKCTSKLVDWSKSFTLPQQVLTERVALKTEKKLCDFSIRKPISVCGSAQIWYCFLSLNLCHYTWYKRAIFAYEKCILDHRLAAQMQHSTVWRVCLTFW